MALTYQRAWSRAEIREARVFAAANYVRPEAGAPGCLPETPVDALLPQIETPGVVYLVARNEQDVIVGAHVSVPRELLEFVNYDPPVYARIYLVALSPAYDPAALAHNLYVTFFREGPQAPDSEAYWSAYCPSDLVVPPGFARGLIEQETTSAEVKYVMAKPPLVTPDYVEVPLANN